MTDTPTLIEAAFEMQRRSIERSQRLFARGLEFQENAVETALRNGHTAQRRAQRRGTELVRRLVAIQSGTLESVFVGNDTDVRSAVDERIGELERTQDDAWEAFEATFLRAFEGLPAHRQQALADSIESVVDARQEPEPGTVEGVRRGEVPAETDQQQPEGVAASVRQASESTVRTTQREAESVLETESVPETVQESVDEADQVTEDLATDTTDAIETAAVRGPDAAEQQLQALEGVGQAYAERLAEAGIETIADLSRTQANTVAEAAEISQVRATDWIQAAQSHP